MLFKALIFLKVKHVEVENTSADFNVLKGFKTEYTIKKIFNFFSKSQWTPPLHFLNFYKKTSKFQIV